MVWNGNHCIGYQSIPCRHPFHWIGMDTIATGTYPFMARVVLACSRSGIRLIQLAAADRGVADALTAVHQAHLHDPVVHLHRLVRRGGTPVPARRAPHRGPLPGRPGRLWRQHRHPAVGYLGHIESALMGEGGVALPRPGRALFFEKDGAGASRSPSASPAPSPPTCSPSSGSPPGSPASAASASRRPSRRRNGPGLTSPWWPCSPTPACAGPRLRPSPRATCSAGSTAPAASPWCNPIPTPRPRARWWPSRPLPCRPWTRYGRLGLGAGRGVLDCPNPDRPAGQGHRQGRWIGRLGILQRPQRPRGHGPAHGPERRAHPRDRAPGPLETGRRHGRTLHPRRVRRIGAPVLVILYPRACEGTRPGIDSNIAMGGYSQGQWANLGAVARVRYRRDAAPGLSTDTRYYTCSYPADAATLLGAARSHWSIENSLRWPSTRITAKCEPATLTRTYRSFDTWR